MRSNASFSEITLPPVPHVLVEELSAGLRQAAEEAVPWFLKRMPQAYFQDTDHTTRLTHLRAILFMRASGLPRSLTLRSDDGSSWTFINERSYPGLLAELVQQLPLDKPLRAAKVHSSEDDQLVLDVFEFGVQARFDPNACDQSAKRDLLLAQALQGPGESTVEALAHHLSLCTAEYVLTVSPLRFAKHWEIYQKVAGNDGAVVELEQELDRSYSRITLAVGNATPRRLFERCASYLGQQSVDIHRAYLDVFEDPKNGQVSVLSFVVQAPERRALDATNPIWQAIKRDLRRIKWLDGRAFSLAKRYPDLGFLKAEVIIGLSSLAHQVLVPEDPYAFSRERILHFAERHLAQTTAIVDLFLARFEPNARMGEDDVFQKRVVAVRSDIERSVDLEAARRALCTLLDAVEATLRTNVYLEARYAFAIRFDPQLLHRPGREEIPYGAFFIHGGSFDGFHVRFRDIARGGLRVVRPLGLEQHALEADRLYDEVYGLALAQQLKNKDIPEGGAKGVLLVTPDASVSRSVKAFADALLDLSTPDPEVTRQIVDRFGKEEILYLGPDENISAELIEWIVVRAKRRGYRLPNAFMSSKPGAGINHKTFGVTSEGVTVFLEVALRAVGIDPRSQPFTVKLTGGPDGDVAGNEIRILHREYGDHARIVGIADGSGSAEDPDGLNHRELLRLVESSAPICAFDRAALGPKGHVVGVDEPDGLKLRNTLHNRLEADAFIPAGGRPQTIHGGNWSQFLTAQGKASSKVIVEGANLFLTPEARRLISEHGGALIIKDSSANKCGVICSSFEIVASILLSEQEFLLVKDRFVDEVLTKLRELARLEAELLFREHRRRPNILLPDLSTRLSNLINGATDAIVAALAGLSVEDTELALQLFVDHLPRVLVEVAGSRLKTSIPPAYLTRAIASALSGRIIYREGMDYLEHLTSNTVGQLALSYLRQERETARLMRQLATCDLPDRERLIELLQRGGTRAGLMG